MDQIAVRYGPAGAPTIDPLTAVIAGRQSRRPKETGLWVAARGAATARTVCMGSRDLRPAVTEMERAVDFHTRTPPSPQ